VEDANNPNRVPSFVEGFDSVCQVEGRSEVAHVS
jgi:hypothetical protein